MAILTALAACNPRDARVQAAGPAPSSQTTAIMTPALQPPPAPHCAQITISGTCQEWTPLSPQPRFTDVLRLQAGSRAPTNVAWGGLYLCGALNDRLLTRHLGAGYFKVIYQNHICGLTSPDQTRDVQLDLGDGPLDSSLTRYSANEDPKKRTSLHGRDAITRVPDDSRNDGLFLDRDVFLSIPATDAFVIVVKIQFSIDLTGTDLHRPDPAAADRLIDELVAAVVELNG